jgi:hypothetical protein
MVTEVVHVPVFDPTQAQVMLLVAIKVAVYIQELM